jgi:hypothetical protein
MNVRVNTSGIIIQVDIKKKVWSHYSNWHYTNLD